MFKLELNKVKRDSVNDIYSYYSNSVFPNSKLDDDKLYLYFNHNDDSNKKKRNFDKYLYDDCQYKLSLRDKDNKKLEIKKIIFAGITFKFDKEESFDGSEYKIINSNNSTETTETTETEICKYCYGCAPIYVYHTRSKVYYGFTSKIKIKNNLTKDFVGSMLDTVYPVGNNCSNNKGLNDEKNISNIMFKESPFEKDFSLLQGYNKSDKGPKSYSHLFDYIDEVLDSYHELFPYFFTNKEKVLLEKYHYPYFLSEKKITKDSINWLVKNPWNFTEDKNGIIKINNKRYNPVKIQSKYFKTSTNTYENQIILSWLHFLINKLNDIIACGRNLTGKVDDDDFFSLDNELDKKRRINYEFIVERAKYYHEELFSVFRKYRKIFEDTSIIDINTKPMFTKVFCELSGYRSVYKLIEKYDEIPYIKTNDNALSEAYGNAFLYEYFVLYSLIYVIIKKDYELVYNNVTQKRKCPKNRLT